MVHIDTQHFTFRRKLAVDLRNIVVTMSHKHAQKFQIAATDQVTCRERVPEQMRMQPFYSGLFL